jgi:serine/threonine protein kinase
LKPGNIMLTKSGDKLLDFGLAKTAAPAIAGNLSILPTTPPGLTGEGTILGTFQCRSVRSRQQASEPFPRAGSPSL